MSKGTYDDFLDALRAFESGWDRARYEQGIITDWQLDQWAGGPVTEHFPGYSSWADLTPSEWDAMSYRSMNSLGFVGYQFGEALLIDLGYYDATFYYGNGAARNEWQGTWTGKNDVESLEDFMTAEKQEVAIREAFGFNLQIIDQGLAAQGQSLAALLGTTAEYQQGGETVEVELTLTGIMAAAHLRGAYGTLALLQAGAVSTDEYGTSILQYIDQFGDYDAPSVAEAIAYFEDRRTGDEGLGGPGDVGSPGDGTPPPDTSVGDDGTTGNGTAGVTKATADVVITWAWGQDVVIEDFDPASGTVFVDWISADHLVVSEVGNSTRFEVPSNNQSTTLQGVPLGALDASNFTILDTTAAALVLDLVGGGSSSDGGGSDPGEGIDPGDGGSDPGNAGNPDDGGTPGEGGAPGDTGNPGTGDPVIITWDWGKQELVADFDPAQDVIDFGHVGAGQLAITERGDDLLIEVLNNGGRVYQFAGLAAEDLARSNLEAAPYNGVLDAAGGVVDQLTALGFDDGGVA